MPSINAKSLLFYGNLKMFTGDFPFLNQARFHKFGPMQTRQHSQLTPIKSCNLLRKINEKDVGLFTPPDNARMLKNV